MPDTLVRHLQLGVIAAAVFICLWGIIKFGPCILAVLRGKNSRPHVGHINCGYHASSGLVCIAAFFFAMSRLDVLTDWSRGTMGGWIWLAAMFAFFMKMGVASWQLGREEQKAPRPSGNSLAWVFSMELIIILAFVVVGLLGAMKG